MDTVYIALVRWGPEWDGQSIYKTKSEALFNVIKNAHSNVYFEDFPAELKEDVQQEYNKLDLDSPLCPRTYY